MPLASLSALAAMMPGPIRESSKSSLGFSRRRRVCRVSRPSILGTSFPMYSAPKMRANRPTFVRHRSGFVRRPGAIHIVTLALGQVQRIGAIRIDDPEIAFPIGSHHLIQQTGPVRRPARILRLAVRRCRKHVPYGVEVLRIDFDPLTLNAQDRDTE